MKYFRKNLNEHGSFNLELALIIGLVAIAVIGTLTFFGTGMSDRLFQQGSELSDTESVELLQVPKIDEGGESGGDGGIIIEDITTASDFEWSDDGVEATVVKYIGNKPNVIVPATYNGLPVTKMFNSTSSENGVFYEKRTIVKTVVLPSSITNIGDYAFRGCDSLTSVVIPNSVTTIGDYAFNNCSSLTSVVIPDSVTSIGHVAFAYCTSLTSIVIPNSVTTIGYAAFNNCSSLASITIPNSVTSIGTWAFWSCTNLTSITIPDNVTTIGNYTFQSCDNLTSITIPNSVTRIGSGAFYDCRSLTSITIPNSVTTISNNAFTNCSSLTSIVIPNSVTSIGNLAFDGCSKLAVAYILRTPSPTLGTGVFPYSTIGSATSIANPSGTYYGTNYTRWYTNFERTIQQTTWPMTRSSTSPTTILYGSP